MLAFITAALQLAPMLIQAGEDVAPLANRLYAVWLSRSDPTDADWAALHAMETAQTAVIDAPIPDDEA